MIFNMVQRRVHNSNQQLLTDHSIHILIFFCKPAQLCDTNLDGDGRGDSDFYAPAMKSRGGDINLPPVRPFIRSDIDTWFVRLSPPTVLELQL